MTNENAIVAVYNSHVEAEQAVGQLQSAGFDMKKLSIVGKDYHTVCSRGRSSRISSDAFGGL